MADAAGASRPTPLKDAISARYLSYALSTIMARSLPDVRDGLKPVHRRLLYAMRELRLDPGGGPKKCARVVGDVMGKFHPHGDRAIYDAMVRLAQDFSVRYPLVEGQGNFGNIDGDNAAAMRYTEARLTDVAMALLDGIDEDAVDFRATYDGGGEEPAVLPAAFPNLLANGATGIAVGMATSIPPHNVGELCAALRHLIRYPNATAAKLVDLVPGPDFPTGGVLVDDRATTVAAYRTGRGAFRLRARWTTETVGRGQYRIVVTEIPYQVAKARLIEKIAELLQARRLPLLADLRDESADDVRIVLEPKSRNVEAAVLMEQLFRHTDLEVRIPLNLNVLDGGHTPRVMPLREALTAFLAHRHEVRERRARHRLERIARRLEVLGGYMIAFLNLDEVIRIIREEDAAQAALMARWSLSEGQAEAILNMRLRALRKLEQVRIREEIDRLETEQAELQGLLAPTAAGQRRRDRALAAEVADISRRFGDPGTNPRRTGVGKPPVAVVVPPDAMIEREPVTVVCSQKGWARVVRGHDVDPATLRYKEGDGGRFVVAAQTTDRLLVFATNGRFYTLGVDRLPGGRGHGEPLRLMIALGNDADAAALRVHRPGGRLLVASSDGRGFVVPEDAVVAQTRTGKQVLNLRDGAEAVACVAADGDHVAVLGRRRRLLIFPLDELPEMTRGSGRLMQRYTADTLADAAVFSMADGLVTRTGARQRTFTAAELRDWVGRRALAGRLPPRGFPVAPRFA